MTRPLPLLATLALTACAAPHVPTAPDLIAQNHMSGIPKEGPYFRRIYTSPETILTPAGPRPASTAILLALTPDAFSALHRLTSDEMWHFYAGSPARLLLLYPDGHGEQKTWGADITRGQESEILVPRGTWVGARPLSTAKNTVTFGANTVTPGFDYTDYEQGYRIPLSEKYPDFKDEIRTLTRDDSLTPPPATQPPVTPVALTEYVGRTAPQHDTTISTSRFTLAPGAEIPFMRTRKGHEVMIVTTGTGTVTIGTSTQPLTPGAVILLPPVIPHRIHATTALSFYVSAAPAWKLSDTQKVRPAPE